MTSVGSEHRSLHVTDGQTIRHSVACGIAAGVAHPATGAQLRPASAMSESVNRCKYGKSKTVTLTSHSSCYNIVTILIVMNGNKNRNICSIHSLSQVVNLEMLAGDDPLPGKSETGTISETDIEESNEESNGSSQNTFRSYYTTTEHYDSESDENVTEASL